MVGERFADRIQMWIPLNEPVVETLYGYAIGEYAPGRTLLFDAIPAAHHQNLANGLAATALRAAGAKSIGTANNHVRSGLGGGRRAGRPAQLAVRGPGPAGRVPGPDASPPAARLRRRPGR